MILMIVACLMGLVLSQRFAVFVLVPAATFVSLIAAVSGTAQHGTFWSVTLGIILALTSLQMGYLAGTSIRHFITSPQPASSHKSFQEPRPVNRGA